mgnify:CR=1 FL=1
MTGPAPPAAQRAHQVPANNINVQSLKSICSTTHEEPKHLSILNTRSTGLERASASGGAGSIRVGWSAGDKHGVSVCGREQSDWEKWSVRLARRMTRMRLEEVKWGPVGPEAQVMGVSTR